MLTDFVRLVIVRGVLTLVVDNLGSQSLEGNRSLNRLGHIIIDGDGDSLGTVSRFRLEGMTLGLTQNGLAVLLGNQLGIQGVFLARNQTLVGNLVHNLGTSNNLTQVALEVRVGRNNRVLVGGYGLVLVVDVLVLSDVIRVLRSGIRSVLTLVVDVGGGQFLKRNRSLNRLLHVVRNSDLNLGLTISGLRLNSSLALAQNGLAVLLGNQLSIELVFLTRNQVEVIDGVDDRSTSNNFLGAVCKVRIGGNARLGGYSLVLVVDVIVLSDVIRGALVGRLIVAILVDLGGGQVLERNSCLDRLGHIIVDNNSDSLSTVSLIRGELVTLGLAKNGLAVFLGNQLRIQSVLLTRNQTLVRNLVHNLGTSNNLTQATLEVSVSGNLRGVLLVVTRGTRLVRLGRLRRLGRLIRGRRLAVRRLVRLRGLGSFRRRGLYRLGLRRLTGLRRFLRLGRLLTLRVTRLLRLAGLVAVIRRLWDVVLRGGGLRSRGLRLILGGYSLSLVLDIGVLGDVILLTSGGILAVLVNSSGVQVLESNCLVNGLGNTLINGDLNLYLALRSGRYEGLFTVADYREVTSGLVLDLGTQLCIQSVFLARNQVVVLNLIGNDGASLDLIALSLLSLGADGWLHLGGYGLCLIIDVAVIGNLLLFVRVRSVLTVLIDLLGVEVLECDGCLNDALNIVVDLNVNDLLTGRLLRGEGYIALADDLVLTLIILSLVTQLSLQGVFLTRHQVGVLNGVLNSNASLYLRSVVKFSLSLDRRGPLGVNGLLLIVDVFVSSNLVLIGGASGLIAFLVYLGRYKLLEGNRSVNSRICLVVDGDLNFLLTSGLFRNEFRRAFTQYGLAIGLGDQLCLQGVLLTRN